MNNSDLMRAMANDTIGDAQLTDLHQYDADNIPAGIVLKVQQKKIERLDEEIKDLRQDRNQRRVFGYALFGFMCLYMAAVLVVIFLCGYGCMLLSDKVLMTLLTTTLANVIGIFSFVAKYLYRNR